MSTFTKSRCTRTPCCKLVLRSCVQAAAGSSCFATDGGTDVSTAEEVASWAVSFADAYELGVCDRECGAVLVSSCGAAN